MHSANRRLLRRPKPKCDESFLGYIIRLSEENGYENPRWLLNSANILFDKNASFLWKENTSFYKLSKIIGLRSARLENLLYPKITLEPHLSFSQAQAMTNSYKLSVSQQYDLRSVFGQNIIRYMIRLNPSKICPVCLAKINYIRKIWDLIPITVCPRHACLLVDSCPKCNKAIEFRRANVSVCPCNFDWRDIKPKKVKGSELLLTKQIYKSCNLPVPRDNVNLSDYGSHFLNMDYFLRTIFSIAGLIKRTSKDTRKILFGTNNIDLHQALNKAFVRFLREYKPQIYPSQPTYVQPLDKTVVYYRL